MQYRDIEVNILSKYSRYMISLDPILSQIGSGRSLHAGGHRYQENGKELITPLNEVSFVLTVSYSSILDYDISAFSQILYEYAENNINEMKKMIFRTLASVSEITGNIVDAKGKPLNFDLILNMLEQVEIDFDELGKPKLPQVFTSPEQHAKLTGLKVTQEQNDRMSQIIAAKRREFHAKKRYRRLSFIN